MDLTTRCPKCGTAFQASLSDLQLRKGYIRCVQCAHIFDGYAEVVSETPLSGGPDAAAAPLQTRAADDADLWHQAALDDDAPQVFRSARAAPPPDARAPHGPEFHVGVPPWPDDRPEPRINLSAAESEPRAAVPDEPPRHQPPAQAAPFVVEARPGHRSQGGSAAPLLHTSASRNAWSGFARFCSWLFLWLLLALLTAQAVYTYRAQIAQAAPVLRPWLEQACAPLHCDVPYARDIARIAITGSALKTAEVAPAEAGADVQNFMLNVTLRNLSIQPQEWPTLVLDLKDFAGTRQVRRNLTPADYLGPVAQSQPFPAQSEVLVRVPLTLNGIRINGFQLDLFFP